eukprot:1395958-Amphidinium_carterae.1
MQLVTSLHDTPWSINPTLLLEHTAFIFTDDHYDRTQTSGVVAYVQDVVAQTMTNPQCPINT